MRDHQQYMYARRIGPSHGNNRTSRRPIGKIEAAGQGQPSQSIRFQVSRRCAAPSDRGSDMCETTEMGPGQSRRWVSAIPGLSHHRQQAGVLTADVCIILSMSQPDGDGRVGEPAYDYACLLVSRRGVRNVTSADARPHGFHHCVQRRLSCRIIWTTNSAWPRWR